MAELFDRAVLALSSRRSFLRRLHDGHDDELRAVREAEAPSAPPALIFGAHATCGVALGG